jgi:hypothetical protein
MSGEVFNAMSAGFVVIAILLVLYVVQEFGSSKLLLWIAGWLLIIAVCFVLLLSRLHLI